MKYSTYSEAQTAALAKKFVTSLKQGTIVGLIGDLGAGKTAFVKGVAKALSLKQTVNSPTFVLMRVYTIKKHPFLKHLIHVDAYRLKSAKSLTAIGLSDYIKDPSALVMIEWADRVQLIIPKSAIMVRFKHLTPKSRQITISK